jgi:hypothetical protein
VTEQEDGMESATRHERGLARLKELGDEPGGDAFIERMGSPMGDWLVDRALRAIDVPWQEIEETILQTAPYAGIPRAINALKVLRTEQGR